MSTEPEAPRRRRSGWKWILILIVFIVVAWIAAWLWLSYNANNRVRAHTSYTANNTARAIALFGSDAIAAGNWGTLQTYADDLVRNRPLEYIAIVDADGMAVVHTNRALTGRTFEEDEQGDKLVQASAPVYSRSEQLATVWVGVRTDRQ